MNDALAGLAAQVRLDAPSSERLRLAFGHACALRVQHLLEDPAVADCVAGLGRYLDGAIDRDRLDALAAQAAALANRHPGSRSLDGCGHAAVSATYAVANALAGKARQAADRDAFAPEHAWQAQRLAALAGQRDGPAPPAD